MTDTVSLKSLEPLNQVLNEMGQDFLDIWYFAQFSVCFTTIVYERLKSAPEKKTTSYHNAENAKSISTFESDFWRVTKRKNFIQLRVSKRFSAAIMGHGV